MNDEYQGLLIEACWGDLLGRTLTVTSGILADSLQLSMSQISSKRMGRPFTGMAMDGLNGDMISFAS